MLQCMNFMIVPGGKVDVTQDLNILKFFGSRLVVKLVLLMLIVASVASWAIVFKREVS